MCGQRQIVLEDEQGRFPQKRPLSFSSQKCLELNIESLELFLEMSRVLSSMIPESIELLLARVTRVVTRSSHHSPLQTPSEAATVTLLSRAHAVRLILHSLSYRTPSEPHTGAYTFNIKYLYRYIQG